MELNQLDPEAQAFLLGDIPCGAVGMANIFAPLSGAPRRNPPLEAWHVLLTPPRRGEDSFRMRPHAQWTARLSALAWKRWNGPIHLITDREGARWARETGLDRIYDSVRDDLQDRYGLNRRKFWAAGKLLALEKLTAPCLILDMDLIVWKPLDIRDEKLAAAHIERICDRYYPGPEHFIMSPRYRFPADWDLTAPPLNTAIVYFADEQLKREYLADAIGFMRGERDTPDDGSVCMIFAEQRILAMCAACRGIAAKVFLDYDRLGEKQDLITHTWSGKRLLSRFRDVEAVFAEQCRKKCEQLEQELNR